MGQIKNIKLHIVTDIKVRNRKMGLGVSVPTPPDVIPDEPAPVMVATQQELMDNKVPLRYRDYCAHLFLPLLKCRRDKNIVLPWHCGPEKAEWDECQIQDYYRRMREMERLRRKGEVSDVVEVVEVQ